MIKGDGTLLQEIDLSPANVHQEVIQNIAVLMDLIKNSCPMFRDGGLPGQLYGRPLPVVENILVGYVYDMIEEYEPRAVIAAVTFEEDTMAGKLIPVIELEGVKEDVE